MQVDRTRVFYTHSIPTQDLDVWVTEVAKRSGQQVVWHIDRGAHILALGDILKVVKAMLELRDQHDVAFRRATSHMREGLVTRALEWIWEPVLQIKHALQGVVTVSVFTDHPKMDAPKPVPVPHPRSVGQGDSFCEADGSTIFSAVFSGTADDQEEDD